MTEFAAFISYASPDDKYSDGTITKFRDHLQAAVRQYTGNRNFQIFQDTKDIRWGVEWHKKIQSTLSSTFLLIPIMTPLYFNSTTCLDEWEIFIAREIKLRRKDLILPIYWIPCDVLDDPELNIKHPCAKDLAARQRRDWRELHWEGSDSAEIRQAIECLALEIKQVLNRLPSKNKVSIERPLNSGRKQQPKKESEIILAESPDTTKSVSTNSSKIKTFVVDAMGRGDYISLVEAVKKCEPGSRLLVRPGFYPGGLLLNKPLEILGEGANSDIVLQSTGSSCILFNSSMGIVRNISLRQIGGGDCYAIDIKQGRLVMENCDISSQSLSCIGIHGEANPIIRNNRIHDGKSAGILVYENGQGNFEDNDIFGNANAGIYVSNGGNPTVRKNHIHDGKASGILVYENGQGNFEDNDIFGNANAGIYVSNGGNPTVRKNHIHDGKSAGIFVNENGQGNFEDNDIFGNAYSGIEVKGGGNPTVIRNRIHDGKSAGIFVNENGQGNFEDNDIFGNANAGIYVSNGGNPTIRKNRIHDNKQSGIFKSKEGQGTFEHNHLERNGDSKIRINPIVPI